MAGAPTHRPAAKPNSNLRLDQLLVDRGLAESRSRAQALVLVTEWSDIVNTDWRDTAERMEPPRFIFDGRNVLDPIEMGKLGFEYMGVGRGRVQVTKPVDNARMDQLHGVNTGIQVGR